MRVSPAVTLALAAAVAAALLAALIGACGGAHQPDPPAATRAPAPAAAPIPDDVTVDVRVTRRFGHLVRLRITGVGKKRRAHLPFENPRKWVITAMADGKMFTRAVNGTARVVRDPVGRDASDLWDIEVSFWVAFNVPQDVASMVVRVEPPGARMVETTLDLDWSMDDLEPAGE